MSINYAKGDEVIVRHDLGYEIGTIISATPSDGAYQAQITVQFADGTISCWPAFRVRPNF